MLGTGLGTRKWRIREVIVIFFFSRLILDFIYRFVEVN